jgi:hypothetical protein
MLVAGVTFGLSSLPPSLPPVFPPAAPPPPLLQIHGNERAVEYSFTRREDMFSMLGHLFAMGTAPDLATMQVQQQQLEAAASHADFVSSALLLGTSEFPGVFRSTSEEVGAPCCAPSLPAVPIPTAE